MKNRDKEKSYSLAGLPACADGATVKATSSGVSNREAAMDRVLFTNVNLIDGRADPAYAADVLVEGERIEAVAAAPRRLSVAGAHTVDGGGATLMPGLIEAHAHLSFCNNKELEEFPRIPVEGTSSPASRMPGCCWTRASPAASAPPPPSRDSTSC
jgi:hypothetical protein